MKVLTPGHCYLLDNFEPPQAGEIVDTRQTLQFIEKKPVGTAGELTTVHNGTTNEEILKVLIDRCKWLQNEFASRQTALAITKMEEALMWFEHRTAERRARGVEGKYVP